jgi:ABC-type transport system involved in cytochrome bd biosynthesis fused ATPase/permease subunit
MIDTGEVDEPQPAIPTSQSTGHPPDLQQRLVQAVQRLRAQTALRTSSALVRWVLLILAVGFGAAMLVAFAVSLLVSLLPGAGG